MHVQVKEEQSELSLISSSNVELCCYTLICFDRFLHLDIAFKISNWVRFLDGAQEPCHLFLQILYVGICLDVFF